jgi:N-acetylneuraminate synthase
VAELGINHNGSVVQALKMMEAAKLSGVDAVKFQKRSPMECVPKNQWSNPKDTPWGTMPYIEYKERMELGPREYGQIVRFSEASGLPWFASVWDPMSLAVIAIGYSTPAIKIPSALIGNLSLIEEVARENVEVVILSTGGASMQQIQEAVLATNGKPIILCHSTSIYPCPKEKLNLRFISTLVEEFPQAIIGYSSHQHGESGLEAAAVALGARYIKLASRLES